MTRSVGEVTTSEGVVTGPDTSFEERAGLLDPEPRQRCTGGGSRRQGRAGSPRPT